MWLCSSSTSIIEDRDPSTHLDILTIRVTDDSTRTVTITDTPSSVPEPTSVILLLTAMAVCGFVAKRKLA
jgi:hypothetical protein